MTVGDPTQVREVAAALRERLGSLPPRAAHRATFLGVYARVTDAVADAVAAGHFEDPAWVSEWDEVFADLFLRAHDADLAGGEVPRPWRLAFGADPAMHPLGHLLLAMNAHINFDLPQSVAAVVSDDDFADPGLLQARDRDHQRIDEVLFARVRAEDADLGWKTRGVDRVLAPANRWASRRFLRESREKVWHNTAALQRARAGGGAAYPARVAELDVLTAAKITEFLRPGPVLLRLALLGFGVTLPPDDPA
ncbi:DUF5995 family protein [Microlunatus flavus]|uniref:Uncharacterized protein n=1 Tax=Microlunatus flavus TaxID=1036181 RepID=A0A1H9IA31_9ACTN|nr:DUF5995 family protein [Microlunatus flavus]SEQ71255.1 hypothetical protein SAMN05421756_105145 [Microlunatus flavus]